jgi:hypothetical protein
MLLEIRCTNNGQSAATNVAGETELIRNGRKESYPIKEGLVLRQSDVYRMFFLTNSYSWDWILRQRIEARISFSFGNGIENASQSSCWKLLVRPNERSFGFADCGNFPEAKKTIH